MSIQNDFKKFFIQTANELLMKRENRKFEIDENNQYALDFFTSYFSDNNKLEKLGGKPHKGIFLYGNYGTGKSLFFETLEKVYELYKNPKYRVKTIHTIELVDMARREFANSHQLAPNDKSIIENYSRGSILFEDLDAESKINHFGNIKDIMSELIQLRYFNSRRAKCITHITSNLTLEEVKARYGERVSDRCYEMFNFINLSGDSRRK
ncbi:P-loop NTPase family protein [Formosa algae]|uniref:hypothetical protein n=1 Tax=Formosa algae TaxID=225843 RepID=UPI000CCE5BEC|nr:hypothetical protein [Formosa algae]PNW27233.1 hypothetical protein BKP44_14170 [Formosa algae]